VPQSECICLQLSSGRLRARRASDPANSVTPCLHMQYGVCTRHVCHSLAGAGTKVCLSLARKSVTAWQEAGTKVCHSLAGAGTKIQNTANQGCMVLALSRGLSRAALGMQHRLNPTLPWPIAVA